MPRELDKTHFNMLNPYDRIDKISAHDKSSKLSSSKGAQGSKMLSKNISMIFYEEKRPSNHTYAS